MQEKIIFDGRLEAKPRDIWSMVDRFLLDKFISPVDISPDFKIAIEDVDAKKVLVMYPPQSSDSPNDKIINGYVEVSQVLLMDDSPVHLRIVSCRPELDVLYFQLSQQIQASFIIPHFPADLLLIPWRQLLEEGFISADKTKLQDLGEDSPDPDRELKRYGSDRSLTKADVRGYVRRALLYQKRNYSLEEYYSKLNEPNFSYETLRSWIKNPEFVPRPKNKIP